MRTIVELLRVHRSSDVETLGLGLARPIHRLRWVDGVDVGDFLLACLLFQEEVARVENKVLSVLVGIS